MSVLAIVVTASLAQNVILVHYLGVWPFPAATQSPKRAGLLSGAVTGALVWTASIYWVVNRLVLLRFNLEILETVVLNTLIALSTIGAMRIGSQIFPFHRKQIHAIIPAVFINVMVFVVTMGLADTVEGYGEVVLGALAAGLGLFIAIVPLATIRRHVEMRDASSIISGDVSVYLATALMALAIQRIDTLLQRVSVLLY